MKFGPRHFIIIAVGVAAVVGVIALQDPDISEQLDPPGIEREFFGKAVEAEEIISAVGRCEAFPAQEQMTCFQEYFRGVYQDSGTGDIVPAFAKAMELDADLRLNCHQVVHAIGREAYAKAGDIDPVFREGEAFNICAGGFFHGGIEAMFRPEAMEDAHITQEEVREKIASICERFESDERKRQCIHGVGHGALYFLDYDLDDATSSCKKLPARDEFHCYSGVFMEYVVAAESPLHDMEATRDPHYPCNEYDGNIYRNPCYYVQAFRMKDLGLSDAEIVDACRTVEGFAGSLCIRGLGVFFLAHEALAGESDVVIEFCSGLAQKRDRELCIESVASRMISHTEDGTRGLPFCAAVYDESLQEACFAYAVDVLRVGFDFAPEAIVDECGKHAPGEAVCTRLAEKE